VKVATYTKSGAKATTQVELDKAIFAREVSPELLKLAYNRVLANARQATAKTKTRGEIRGGGKKPWRQKGTGRARTGSIRNPLWRGGGTIFGPTGEQNYSIAMPKKAIRASVAHALSAQAKQISVIDSFLIESGKTKDAATLLAKLGDAHKTLIVVDKPHAATQRAVANVQSVLYVSVTSLTAYEIMNADAILIEKPALDTLKKWLEN
jgi:large subunit ribosomal protein L4